MADKLIQGNVVDILTRRIYSAELSIRNGKIHAIREISNSTRGGAVADPDLHFIIPGFIDSHVHIESSMLLPYEFGRLAVVHGTVASVSDPHEIANVCGIEGVDFMIENGRSSPFKCYFGAPSCVPATVFETAGAKLDSKAVSSLLKRKEIRYLSEMMNFPGVLSGDMEVIRKIESARQAGKPVDGHAPGLRGSLAKQYIDAGISTDHECVSKDEAMDKLNYGMKIIIREGSAAKNFDALIDLLHDYPESIMFCSDDKHPDSLVAGHINQLCARAAIRGIDIFKILRAACLNPVIHYGLDVGLLKKGDPADFIVVDDLKQFQVLRTYIRGILVAEKGRSLIPQSGQNNGMKPDPKPLNHFDSSEKKISDFEYPVPTASAKITDAGEIEMIEALDGQLITNRSKTLLPAKNGQWVSDIKSDVLKMVVVNRYADAPVAKAFVKNFGLHEGAIASSVAHDSHNLIAVGAEDESLCRAINLIITEKGGISCVGKGEEMILPLPVAGLMSTADGYAVAAAYTAIDAMAKRLGSRLTAPFMTLSFMALLVIPHLKLSDLGLFDGDKFRLIEQG